MYFWKYRLRKTWLNKFLKSSVSGDRSPGNMANGLKRCCNLNDSPFTIFINHCGHNYIEKKSLLVIYKMVRHFVNTLTAHGQALSA